MSKDRFELVSPFQPTGDQPEAIDALVKSIETGNRMQTLKGVTGSGKTFTMANIIQRINRPTLVLAHNKTLAAQLCSEFKEFFPKNAVEYFVSYYDYYQPEAYIASTDTYIEKDSAINEEIEKLRHSATSSLSERRDVIIVSSISCIYTLGDPIDYRNMVISLRQGMTKDRDELIRKLVEIQYERNDINFVRNKFRVRGDVVEIFPAYSSETAIRVEFFGDEVDRICEINTVTGEVKNVVSHVAIYPASHYIVPRGRLMAGIEEIRRECDELVEYFRANNKLIEAQRIMERAYLVRRVTAYRLCEIMRKNQFDGSEARAVEGVMDCDLLFIDDLGTEPQTKNTSGYLFQVINERNMNDRHTIISTNLNPERMEGMYEQRVASRLMDVSRTTAIRFYGEDLRLRK